MIVLDTNVVSELMRPQPDRAVVSWMNGQVTGDLYFTAVGEAELLYGLAIMTPGSRRDALVASVEAMLHEDFASRILPFDSSAARAYSTIAATRRASARPIGTADAQIAAIALSRSMSVATRNVRDFVDTGVDLIDPWA